MKLPRLELTPWAAKVLTADDRAALLARVPDGYVLRIGGGRAGHWSMYLVDATGCVASTHYEHSWQTAAATVFAAAVL